MKRRVFYWLRWLAPLIWMALIFYGSSRQRISVADQFWLNFLFFKTLHIIEYGVLFFLWNLALYKNKNSKLLAAIISILYGISDELHQRFVPTREGRVRDVFIDALGVLIFWRLVWDRFVNIIKSYKVFRRLLLYF